MKEEYIYKCVNADVVLFHKHVYPWFNSRSNKTLKSESDLNISFNKDYPLKLVFNYPDKYVYRFILAPKIDND